MTIRTRVSLPTSAPAVAAGFSLIEMLVTIAIVAILLSVALPSMADAIARNRIASSANDFLASVNYARTEAIRRNGTAGICPTASGVLCDGAWGKGMRWLVYFGDPASPGVLSGGEFDEKDQFTKEPQSLDTIRFNARGMLVSEPGVIELRPTECSAGKPMRRLFNVHRTGSVSMTPGACL